MSMTATKCFPMMSANVSPCPVKTGATAAGVPGEVKGFHEAWKKYGKLPWKDLVQPSIEMAKNGFSFGYSAHYAATRSKVTPLLRKDAGFR